ncbi:hypothetical protein SBOR_3498 [Sclerotinia borealis F-4128]|uniref:Uncharacterized protein n=1 Tax=Sclerotinia borealis (strain F-4128) TaxID=1432307 RepID=W9CN78_SCLBF|nr:hypothetical protein SBOR_3498 [Sclerotinia borealis F-4128]
MATPKGISPVDSSGNPKSYNTPKTPTPAQPKGKGKGQTVSRIPTPNSVNRSRSSTLVRSNPISIVHVGPSNTRNTSTTITSPSIRTPPTLTTTLVRSDPISIVHTGSLNTRNTSTMITSPSTGTPPTLTIGTSNSKSKTTPSESQAPVIATDRFQSTSLELPQSQQVSIPIVVANMTSPLSYIGKSPATAVLSTSEPPPLKSLVTTITSPPIARPVITSSMVSPPVFLSSMASTQYTSFTHSPPQPPPTPNPPTPSPPLPLPKPTRATQSTPLLPSHQTNTNPPPGFYEYHTIRKTTLLPLPPQSPSSPSSSSLIHTSFR